MSTGSLLAKLKDRSSYYFL